MPLPREGQDLDYNQKDSSHERVLERPQGEDKRRWLLDELAHLALQVLCAN